MQGRIGIAGVGGGGWVTTVIKTPRNVLSEECNVAKLYVLSWRLAFSVRQIMADKIK